MLDHNLVAATFICLSAYIFNSVSLSSHLRRNHHDVWTSLGEPSLLNYSARNSGRLARFIWSDPKTWDDEKVRRYILVGRFLYVLGITVFALMFLLLIPKAFIGPS